WTSRGSAAATAAIAPCSNRSNATLSRDPCSAPPPRSVRGLRRRPLSWARSGWLASALLASVELDHAARSQHEQSLRKDASGLNTTDAGLAFYGRHGGSRYESAVVTRARLLRERGCYESAVATSARLLRAHGCYESAVAARARLLRGSGGFEEAAATCATDG